MPPAPVRAFALAAVLPCPDGIASSSLSQPRPSVRCPCCCQNRQSAPAASWPRSASPASIAQRTASTENRKPPEQALLGLVEEVIAPGDRASQGSLAFGQGSTTRNQQGETALKPGQHLLRGQHLYPRGGELDGERQPVQPSCYLCHRLGVLTGKSEAWLNSQGALREEPHCLGAIQGVEIGN